MTKTLTKNEVRQAVRSAANSLKKGEITSYQFQAIAAQGMAYEIRSTINQKSANYLKKYAPQTKRK